MSLEDVADLIEANNAYTNLGSVAGGAIAVPQGKSDITLTANGTFTFPPAVAGATVDLVITQDGTGSRTMTVAGSPPVVFSGGSKTLTTTAAAIDKISGHCDGTTWFVTLAKAFA